MTRTDTLKITLANHPCDRCGKVAPALHAFKLAESIVYYGRVIDHPWLCRRCFAVEKERLWRAADLRVREMPL